MLASYPNHPPAAPAFNQDDPAGFDGDFISISDFDQKFQQVLPFDPIELDGSSQQQGLLAPGSLMPAAPILSRHHLSAPVQRSSMSARTQSRRPSSLQNSIHPDSIPSASSWTHLRDDVPSFSTATSAGHQRPDSRHNTHRRAQSGSSAASAGTPSSPFNSNTSNPYIAHPDTGLSGAGMDPAYYDILTAAEQSQVNISKLLPTPSQTPSQDSFLAHSFKSYASSEADVDAKMAMFQALKEQTMENRESPAPGFSSPGRPSVSSVGHHSPATPLTSFGDDFDDGPRLGRNDLSSSNVDSVMSDIFAEEAASVPYGQSAAQPSKGGRLHSPYRAMFDGVQAVSSGHFQAHTQPPSEPVSTDSSPFQQHSLYGNQQGAFRSPAGQGQIGRQDSGSDGPMYRQHQFQASDAGVNPKAVSPKDAALVEYNAPEGDDIMSLFPPTTETNGAIPLHDRDLESATSNNMNGAPIVSDASSPQMQGSSYAYVDAPAAGAQMPQTYPFVAHRRRPNFLGKRRPGELDQAPEFPAHLVSMETSISETGPEMPTEAQQPLATESSTYSCTYHGCTLRFETQAKLQRHKREGHRQLTPNGSQVSAAADPRTGMAGAVARNSQAGPHKCERINPSTGKPCNTIFSRPYDLTRHEDTIHNARKQKVRCQLCTEDKSFSRNDALTRHMRVVHPEVEFGNRSRRKGH